MAPLRLVSGYKCRGSPTFFHTASLPQAFLATPLQREKFGLFLEYSIRFYIFNKLSLNSGCFKTMAKVFTITEGLENMGALRTGGQGSVYKGRRANDVITAVKLLPTPIHSESKDDRNYVDFQNEVEKLKKVNEHPNPNVVKILSHGITDSGGFPFIEMEFIEGPDLAELLQPPNNPIFTVEETLKVAIQLSNALAHCHNVGVRHGDIKSNNVKLNTRTGNYILLDFGLAVMTDEQRRTSLRHAGAIEFMAPEQNEGLMFFQTDIYSYGVVMFELIAGRVPFPLNDKGETARNHVMLSHMEDPLPDLMLLRKHNLPQGWTKEQKQREMMVPQWLVETIVKCLEKKPVNRFANGSELHSHLLLQLAKSAAAQAQMAIAEPIKTSVTTEEETTETEAVYVASKADSVYQRNLAAQERLRRENERFFLLTLSQEGACHGQLLLV
jgi:serine/threonine-protein kinase